MAFKEIQINSSGLEPKALVSKLELMNNDTYQPILNRIRNNVQWFSSDIFNQKVKTEYPNLWIMSNSDDVTIDSLSFYVAYSNPVETHLNMPSIKLGFSAYDPQVPRQPKEIRRQIHLDAYKYLLPFLNSKYNNPIVFVKVPETSYPIISIFGQLAFRPIVDPELLDVILTAHDIKYCVPKNISSEESRIRYQVTEKHSGINDGTYFLGYMYRNPHPSLLPNPRRSQGNSDVT